MKCFLDERLCGVEKHHRVFLLLEKGDSAVSQAPLSHLQRLITQPKNKKKSKRPQDNSIRTRRRCLVKENRHQKSRDTVPLMLQNFLYFLFLFKHYFLSAIVYKHYKILLFCDINVYYKLDSTRLFSIICIMR